MKQKAVDPSNLEIRILEIHSMLKQNIKPWEFDESYIENNQTTFYRQDIEDLKALSRLGL